MIRLPKTWFKLCNDVQSSDRVQATVRCIRELGKKQLLNEFLHFVCLISNLDNTLVLGTRNNEANQLMLYINLLNMIKSDL